MIIYLLVLSILSFLFMAYDKVCASLKKRRIPEHFLHLIELLGGIFGSLLAMILLRHKIKKLRFLIISLLILVVWIAIIGYGKPFTPNLY